MPHETPFIEKFLIEMLSVEMLFIEILCVETLLVCTMIFEIHNLITHLIIMKFALTNTSFYKLASMPFVSFYATP